jgi:hypothetical protein
MTSSQEKQDRNVVPLLSLRNIIGWIITLAVCFTLPVSVFGNDSSESSPRIWTVGEQRWTLQEENGYSEWVEANITEDFFVRHDIPVDCADAVYAIRWIYARIRHLPAAATTEDDRLIGHWSTDWGYLPTDEEWHKDRRFRAALLSLFSKTSTRSMPADVYPIRVASDSVMAGTIFLIAEAHTGIVRTVVMDGSAVHPVQTLEATSPSRIQKLIRGNFFSPAPEALRHSGLVKFRWPIEKDGSWQYLPREEHPYYSEEQYSPAFNEGYGNYLESVAKRIDPTVYDPEERIDNVLVALIRLLLERIALVFNGNGECGRGHCPEGSISWHIYNTSGRDELISGTISYLEEFIAENHVDREAVLAEMGRTRLEISPDRLITLKDVYDNAAWMSPDPEAPITARWGLDKCRMITAQIRDAQAAIAFIRKTYGKTDPTFAERSLWVRQKIVAQMAEEGRKNNCSVSAAPY